MDSVPLEFSERVLATRKCCERFSCSCSNHRFAARNWNQPEKTRIFFKLGFLNGRWRYTFCYVRSSESLSLDQVMRLKNVRISYCNFWARSSFDYDVEDMEKLLKVVSFLSNEPWLNIYREKDQYYGCKGEKLLNWLTETCFSNVYVLYLTPVRCQIIENQFSRWKPTMIEVQKVQENAEFVENRLMSGDLRRFRLHEPYQFPSAVLVQIIQNVLEAPEDYRTNGLDICVCFDDSLTALMDEMTESGRCRREAGRSEYYKYIFDDQAPVLKVENHHEHRWRLECAGLKC